jgi:hypothetical protein
MIASRLSWLIGATLAKFHIRPLSPSMGKRHVVREGGEVLLKIETVLIRDYAAIWVTAVKKWSYGPLGSRKI